MKYGSKEYSELTGIPMRTVQWMAKRGEIGQKIGRDWRYTDQDVKKGLKIREERKNGI